MEEVTYPPMEELLPHRGPMILLDRMVQAGELECVCEAVLRPEGLFASEDGVVPGIIGLELMAQTIAAFSGYRLWRAGRPIEPGFLIGSPQWNSQCRDFVVGQQLRIIVRRIWGETELMRFSCRIEGLPAGEALQEGELNVFKPENIAGFLEANR